MRPIRTATGASGDAITWVAGPMSGQRPEGAEALLAPASPGLVHSVSSGDSTQDQWAAFELARRLSRMRRRTITRARIQAEEAQAWRVEHGIRHDVQLVTFTYAPGAQWSPWHISRTMHCYRDQAHHDHHPFCYEWVAELQLKRMRNRGESARECLHYHAIIWQFDGYEFPHPDEVGWWPHGMTKVERARNPVGYLAKYASKGTEGEALPRGARISGGGGLSEHGRAVASWWLRPRYVREAFPDVLARVTRARGGGWVDRDTGEWLRAPSFDWRQGVA